MDWGNLTVCVSSVLFCPKHELVSQDAKLRKLDEVKEFVDPMPINCLKNKKIQQKSNVNIYLFHL